MVEQPSSENILGVVGPCSAGKTTLIGKLQKEGYICRHIAQEHSYVPDMWLKLVNPAALIYLDVSYTESLRRRNLNLTRKEFQEQLRRLSHARENAHLYVDTNDLSPTEVFQQVINSLHKLGVDP